MDVSTAQSLHQIRRRSLEAFARRSASWGVVSLLLGSLAALGLLALVVLVARSGGDSLLAEAARPLFMIGAAQVVVLLVSGQLRLKASRLLRSNVDHPEVVRTSHGLSKAALRLECIGTSAIVAASLLSAVWSMPVS